jgi:hypothetical protein
MGACPRVKPQRQKLRDRNCLADAEQQNAKAQGRKEIPFGSPKDAPAPGAAPTPVGQGRSSRPFAFAFCFFIQMSRSSIARHQSTRYFVQEK